MDFLRLNRLRDAAMAARAALACSDDAGALLTELIAELDGAMLDVVTEEAPKPDPEQRAFEAFDCYRAMGVMAS